MSESKWRMTEEKEGHQWGFWKQDQFQCCQLCGIIRRADDKNSPCKGKAKLRPMEQMNHDATPTAKPEPGVELAREIAEAIWTRFKVAETSRILTAGTPVQFIRCELDTQKLSEHILPILSAHQQRQDEVVEGLRRELEERYQWMKRNDESQSAAVESAFQANNRAVKAERECDSEIRRGAEMHRAIVSAIPAIKVMLEEAYGSSEGLEMDEPWWEQMKSATAILSQPLAG